MNCKLLAAGLVVMGGSLTAAAKSDPLRFNPENFTQQTLTMPDGSQVSYKAYEGH